MDEPPRKQKREGENGTPPATAADFAELVFGFVYGVATDADPVITTLKRYLRQYRYNADEFRISEQLRTLDLGITFDENSAFERMMLQHFIGSRVRLIIHQGIPRKDE
jgi:hypothetical protein